MTADATPTEAAPETGAPETPEEKPRADIPPEVERALKKANREAETLRRQLKEYEDRDKTDAERIAEKATTAEQRAVTAEKALVRMRVAYDKQLPRELAERLQGDTEEELAADADKLLELITPAPSEEEPAPPGFFDLGQGVRTDTTALNGDPLLVGIESKLGIR